jgi:hypothetical protein
MSFDTPFACIRSYSICSFLFSTNLSYCHSSTCLVDYEWNIKEVGNLCLKRTAHWFMIHEYSVRLRYFMNFILYSSHATMVENCYSPRNTPPCCVRLRWQITWSSTARGPVAFDQILAGSDTVWSASKKKNRCWSARSNKKTIDEERLRKSTTTKAAISLESRESRNSVYSRDNDPSESLTSQVVASCPCTS